MMPIIPIYIPHSQKNKNSECIKNIRTNGIFQVIRIDIIFSEIQVLDPVYCNISTLNNIRFTERIIEEKVYTTTLNSYVSNIYGIQPLHGKELYDNAIKQNPNFLNLIDEIVEKYKRENNVNYAEYSLEFTELEIEQREI